MANRTELRRKGLLHSHVPRELIANTLKDLSNPTGLRAYSTQKNYSINSTTPTYLDFNDSSSTSDPLEIPFTVASSATIRITANIAYSTFISSGSGGQIPIIHKLYQNSDVVGYAARTHFYDNSVTGNGNLGCHMINYWASLTAGTYTFRIGVMSESGSGVDYRTRHAQLLILQPFGSVLS